MIQRRRRTRERNRRAGVRCRAVGRTARHRNPGQGHPPPRPTDSAATAQTRSGPRSPQAPGPSEQAPQAQAQAQASSRPDNPMVLPRHGTGTGTGTGTGADASRARARLGSNGPGQRPGRDAPDNIPARPPHRTPHQRPCAVPTHPLHYNTPRTGSYRSSACARSRTSAYTLRVSPTGGARVSAAVAVPGTRHAAAPRRRRAPRRPAGRRRARRTRPASGTRTGTPKQGRRDLRGPRPRRAAPPMSSTRSTGTPWPRSASRPSASPHSMPSTAARARFAGVALPRVSPCEQAAGVGQVRGAFARPGTAAASTRPRRAAPTARARPSPDRSTPSSAAAGRRTRAALRVRDERQVAGRSRRRTRRRCRSGRRPAARETPKTVPEVPSDTTTSPGRRPRPSAAAMLSPVPGAEQRHRRRSSPDHLGRPGDPRHGRVPARTRSRSRSRPVRAGRRRPVPGAGGVAAVGGRLGVRPGPPAAARSASRAAARPRAARAAFSGSCSASQRSLVTVKLATGTQPDGVGPACGPPQLGDQVGGGAGGAGVVPQQRVADDLAGLVERDHAVLLAADADRRDAVQSPPASATPRCSACHQCAGSTSVAVGMRGAALPHDLTGVGVADQDLASTGWTSRPPRRAPAPRRHEPRTPSRCSIASWSRCSNAVAARGRASSGSNVSARSVVERTRPRPGSATASSSTRAALERLRPPRGRRGTPRPSPAGSGSCACRPRAVSQTPSSSSVRGGL